MGKKYLKYANEETKNVNDMNARVIDFINDIINTAPQGNKDALIDYIVERYGLTQDRKVYYCGYFAVRISYSRNRSFSNTVLSLSALQKYDKIPFFVVLVHGDGNNEVYLANTTFLSRISHSSRNLSINNIRGSFNGCDIIKEYGGIKNSPENFNDLFAIHEGLDWIDNLKRLVDASSNIQSRSQKFQPNDEQKSYLMESVHRAQDFISSANFCILNDDLNERCNKCREAILVASHIENVNLRGRIIEYLITTDDDQREKIMIQLQDCAQSLPEIDTHDDLGDYVRVFDDGTTYTDIKTKVIYLNSAPKAYNIDKFLEKMSVPDSSFFFFFIGIDERGVFNTALCSVYHSTLIDASIFQHHWAGRATRGVVQFRGRALNDILQQKSFKNNIDQNKAETYLRCLLAR